MTTIGMIGTGDMGKPLVRYLAEQNSKDHFLATDLPKKLRELEAYFRRLPNVEVLANGIQVSRRSDISIWGLPMKSYSEVAPIVAQAAKYDSTVIGIGSVMGPQKEAFINNTVSDVGINLFHQMHGPSINPKKPAKKQKLAVADVRGGINPQALEYFERLGYVIAELESAEAHDKTTADTQPVPHALYLSMAFAWARTKKYPWERAKYASPIDTIKMMTMSRILS